MGSRLSKQEIDNRKIEVRKNLSSLLDSTFYENIPKPEKTDWLYNVRERGQTVEQYLNSKYTKPDETRNIIYLVPLDSSISLLDEEDYIKISEYVKIYFQMRTILLEKIDIKLFSKKSRNNENGEKQYLTRDILLNLKNIIPKDAFCLMALTTKDLYPNNSYSFIFGEASYYERVGIFSVARFSADFYKNISKEEVLECKKKFGLDIEKAIINDTLINRSLKIITHEIIHMFSIEHCIFFNCLMCGCNGLSELDKWSFTLCPICIQKLYIANPFDVYDRQKSLAEFYHENFIENEYNKNKQILEKFQIN